MKNFVKHMPMLLCSVCFLQSTTGEAGHRHTNGAAGNMLTTQHLHVFITDQTALNQQQPDPKKKADQVPKAKKSSLLKMLTDFVKFKKKADKKFDTRMLSAIEDIGLKDSIAATNINIQLMIAALRNEKNQDYDSVKSMMHALMQRQKSESYSVNAPPESVGTNPAGPSDYDLETLAGELLPIINQKTSKEQVLKEKNEKLRLIAKIKNAGSKTLYTLKLPNNVTRKYRLALKNKAEVFGFFDAGASVANTAAFVSASNALVYYGLTLNESNGNFDELNGWYTSPVVSMAQEKGSKIYFSVLISNKAGNSPLLYNHAAMEQCAGNVLALLKKRNANGINISFKNLRNKDKALFPAFIRQLFQTLKKENPAYQLYVTIPRIDLADAYDMNALKEYADKFFIDFATNTAKTCGPLAPLTGGSHQTIDASVSRYLTNGLNPDKMIVMLPYRGSRWLMNAALSEGSFVDYANFADIQRISNSAQVFDEENTSMYIDTVYQKDHICRIWYDNEATLGKKFDYILENGIGGVALCYINYDGFFNELSSELVYKFTSIDTTYVKDSVKVAPVALSFFQKLKRHLALYSYILQNPCANCFENAAIDSKEKTMLSTYLKDLKFDSLIMRDKITNNAFSKATTAFKSDIITIKDEFNYANRELNIVLKYIALFFFVVSCGFIAFYIYGIKYNDGDWHYKKLVAGVLIFLVSLFMLFGFTYCFTSDLIPLFGVSAAAFNNFDCSIDPNCINIPFTTLLLIIFLSMILGLLIFKYLITSILKRDNVP